MRQYLSQGVACALNSALLAVLLTSGPTATAADPETPARGGLLGDLITVHEALLILDGNYYQDGIGGFGPAVVGEAYQPSLVLPHPSPDLPSTVSVARSPKDAEDGFNFRAGELSFAATVTPYFDVAIRGTVDGAGISALENAWIRTRGLPYGLRLKAGKFNSDFGYINKQHPHDWDFVDQNLPYLNFFGESLIDTGVQLAWRPDLPLRPMIGAELFRGNQEVFGATLDADQQQALALGNTAGGMRMWSAFAKVAPDLGERHSLVFGLSYTRNRQYQQVQPFMGLEETGAGLESMDLALIPNPDEALHTPGMEADPVFGDLAAIRDLGLAGSREIWGLELVYQYQGGGVHGHGNFKFQTEYLRSIKHLDIRYSPDPTLIGLRPTFTTDGLYAQALYGFAPHWTAGVRYDVLGLTNQVSGGPVGASFGASNRWTFDVTWNFWKTSKLRAQYAWNDILVTPDQREHFDAFYLQLLVELGKKEDEDA
jgi:hypothetical protein